MMAWDLSPVRPWEYWELDATEWTEAEQTQAAFRAGLEDAEKEAKRRDDEERRRKQLLERTR